MKEPKKWKPWQIIISGIVMFALVCVMALVFQGVARLTRPKTYITAAAVMVFELLYAWVFAPIQVRWQHSEQKRRRIYAVLMQAVFFATTMCAAMYAGGLENYQTFPQICTGWVIYMMVFGGINLWGALHTKPPQENDKNKNNAGDS